MNIPLLREVQAYILAEPKRFRMDSWAENSDESPCGTTLCIAGAALSINAHVSRPAILRAITNREGGILSLYEIWGVADVHHVEAKARELLGLTHHQAQVLFFDFQWPEPFISLAAKAETPEARAVIGAARIEHFIQTGA